MSSKAWFVLEGGGAKGAYTCGALTVMKARGLEPSAIAGSSAGALNALAVAADMIEDARDAWLELSYGKLLAGSGLPGGWLSRATVSILGIIGIILNLITAPFSNRRSIIAVKKGQQLRADPQFLRQLVGLIRKLMAPFIVFWLVYIALPHWAFDKIPNIISTIFGVLLGLSVVYAYYNGAKIIFQTFLGMVVVYFSCLLFALGLSLLIPRSYVISQVLLATGRAGVAGVLTVVIAFLLIEVPRQLLSLIGRKHLRGVLAQFIQSPMRARCVVTASQLVRVADPDNDPFVSDPRHFSDPALPDWNLRRQYRHVARYYDLALLSATNRIDILNASAALPLGILKPVKFYRRDLEDGGIADNCPLLSFLRDPVAQRGYVVLVNPIPDIDDPAFLGTRKGQDIAKKHLIDLIGSVIEARARRMAYLALLRKGVVKKDNDAIFPQNGQDPELRKYEVLHEINKIISHGEHQKIHLSKILLERDLIVLAPGRALSSNVKARMLRCASRTARNTKMIREFFPSLSARLRLLADRSKPSKLEQNLSGTFGFFQPRLQKMFEKGRLDAALTLSSLELDATSSGASA